MNRGLAGAVSGAVVVVGVPLLLLSPYLRSDIVLDRIVKVVALDWRDFGEARARERLQYELDHRGIGLHVRAGDCTLSVIEGRRHVGCSWALRVPVPGAQMVVPLAFRSEAWVNADGDVEP